jgi:hypothetical protein
MAEEMRKRKRLFEDLVSDEAIDHIHAARKEMRQGWEAFLPPGFIEHRRAARREMLMAFRSILDAAVRRLEAEEKAL